MGQSGVDIANCLNDYFILVFLKDESLDESVIFPEKCISEMYIW